MTEAELWEKYRADFLALENHPGVILELTAIEAWCLASQIQLACRHPDNVGESRRLAEGVARQILTGLATTPALKTIAKRGWDPAYDIELLDVSDSTAPAQPGQE